MTRYLGRGAIAYSQRTGRKVKATDLVEDGHIKGLWVERGEDDKEHPQKHARKIPADRIQVRRGIPERSKGPVTIRVGYEAGSNLWEARQQFQQLSLGPLEAIVDATQAYLVTEDGVFLIAEDGSSLLA
jgi:hypothetical protein